MNASRTLPCALAAALAIACSMRHEPSRLDEALPADPAAARVPDDPIADWELPPGAFDRVERLFAQQCALCHGDQGRGDGPASPLLLPPPRDFGEGRFQLVSTRNAYPTDDDLRRALVRGLPGSSMPSFAWLTDEDLDLLAQYVRKLSIESMVGRLTRRGMSEEEAFETARTRMAPGASIELGKAPAGTPDRATLERGLAIYRATCAPCHGEDGRGRREEPRWNEKGDIEWARDLTNGVLKGGATHTELAYRIESGMPGSSMPAMRFEDPAERDALIAYVQTLLPTDANERMVHRQGTIRAKRVDELPRAADELGWRQADAVEVVLAPNSWRDDSILGASVQALHDGERIAVRVCWEDTNRNDRPFGEFEFPDQVATMLSPASADGEMPPYGMGSAEHPVDLWHWTAFRLEDVAGALDLIDNELHQRGDVLDGGGITDVPGYVPAKDAPEHARALSAHGMDARTGGLPIEADARWAGDGWAVVFVRALEAPSRREVPLAAGGTAMLSLAVWNGAARDHGGQKSLSIWQELRLDP